MSGANTILRSYIKAILETSSVVRREFDTARDNLDVAPNIIVPPTFAGSKMVDGAGTPLLFYHGTRSEFDKFSDSFLNTSGTNISTNFIGFYFTTSPDVARVYMSKRNDPRFGPNSSGHIGIYILDVKKPYHITEKTYWKWGRAASKEMETLVVRLRSEGYDAVVMPSVWRGRGRGAFDVVVFDTAQIINASGKEGTV